MPDMADKKTTDQFPEGDGERALSQAELSRIAEVLRTDAVFGSIASGDLSRLLGRVSVRHLRAGDELQSLGQIPENTYLILSGSFTYRGDAERFITVSSGLIGEEAVLKMSACATTIAAAEDSEVVVFPRYPLMNMVWDDKELRSLMLASLSDRFAFKAGAECRPSDDQGNLQPCVGPAVTSALENRRRFSESDGIHNLSKTLGWLLVLLLPCLTYFGMTRFTSLETQQAGLMGAILVASVTMWIFRLMPDFVPALFGVMGIILFGLAPPNIALSGFASDSFFLALGIFGLSTVLTNSGCSYRILLWLLRIGPANKLWYNFSLFATGLALTPLVPSANGRAAIVTPFLNDLISSIDANSAKSEGPRLGASVLGGISLMTAMFLSSKAINFVVFGFLPLQEQSQYNWFFWFIAASVCGLVLLAVFFIASFLIFRNDARPHIPVETVRIQSKLLGPIKKGEWAAFLGLALLLLSFLTVSIHRIAIPWISLAIISALLMFGFLNKSEFRRKVDWGFLVYLGGLIGMIATLQYLDMDDWLTKQLDWLAVYMKSDFNLFILILAGSIFVVRLALPINATVVIFATLLIPTAINSGVNPWLIGFLVLLFSESYIWPYQSSYYMQYQSLAGKVALAESGRTAFFNTVMAVAKVGAVYASIPFWRGLGVL